MDDARYPTNLTEFGEPTAVDLYSAVLRAAVDYSIIGTAPDGIITVFNKGAERLLGYAAGDVIGNLTPLVFHDPDEIATRAAELGVTPGIEVFIAEARRGTTETREWTYIRRDGSRFTAALTVTAMRDPTGKLVGFVGIARDITKRKVAEAEQIRLDESERAARAVAEDAARRVRFLAGASSLLVASLDYETTLVNVANLAIPNFAEACVVDTIEDGRLRQLAVSDVIPEHAELLRDMRRHYPIDPTANYGVAKVIRTGEPEIVSNVDEGWVVRAAHDSGHEQLLRQLGLVSYLTVPLQARGHTLGAISFVSVRPDRHYSPDDLALAEDLAHRCALAVDNARLYRETQVALAREQQARAEAERLATERDTIFNKIGDGVVIADPSGMITFVNDSARRLCHDVAPGARAEECFDPNRVLTMDRHPLVPERVPIVQAVRQGQSPQPMELRICATDGTDSIVEAAATIVVSEDGRNLGAVMTLHDVTAQRDLEQRKDEFFANVSHDLRTPLTAIKASIGVVLANEPPDTPEPLHRLLTNIDHAADRLVSMVSDLLELTRLQARRVQFQPRLCDLRDIAHHSARSIEPLARDRAQRLQVDLPPQPVITWVDPDRLERALLNLLENAQKFGRAGGIIQLRLEQNAGEAVFGVTNDGPGIPEVELRHIFERFYRSETEAVQRNQGSGLGLPIARAMIELHGGRIWVQSTPGVTTTFWVALPITQHFEE